jgi:hypothetical protein
MKKISAIALACLFIAKLSISQTTKEWTQQKSTQKKYLIQQIAALHTYIGYAKKGYNIASKGINTIRNIKNGDFNLNRDFFGSQKQINPKIKKYARLADLLAYQYRIIKKTKQVISAIQQTSQLTTDEIDYCKKVFDNLLDECVKTIDEVITILTPDEFTMKDDERLKRVDNTYTDMQDKYAFYSSFSNEMGVLIAQRIAEQYEINRSKILNSIK